MKVKTEVAVALYEYITARDHRPASVIHTQYQSSNPLQIHADRCVPITISMQKVLTELLSKRETVHFFRVTASSQVKVSRLSQLISPTGTSSNIREKCAVRLRGEDCDTREQLDISSRKRTLLSRRSHVTDSPYHALIELYRIYRYRRGIIYWRNECRCI